MFISFLINLKLYRSFITIIRRTSYKIRFLSSFYWKKQIFKTKITNFENCCFYYNVACRQRRTRDLSCYLWIGMHLKLNTILISILMRWFCYYTICPQHIIGKFIYARCRKPFLKLLKMPKIERDIRNILYTDTACGYRVCFLNPLLQIELVH